MKSETMEEHLFFFRDENALFARPILVSMNSPGSDLEKARSVSTL